MADRDAWEVLGGVIGCESASHMVPFHARMIQNAPECADMWYMQVRCTRVTKGGEGYHGTSN